MAATAFTPLFSIRLHPAVVIDHGADKLAQLLRAGRVKQDFNHSAIEAGEAETGHDAGLAGVEIASLDPVREHADFVAHWRIVLSLADGSGGIAQKGQG